MHDTIIAKELIEKAKEQGDVKSIVIEVGDLAHLPAGEIKEILELMTNWEIKVIEKIAKVRCKCGYIGKPKILKKMHSSTVFVCQKCSAIPQVLEGRDIILKEVIVD